MNKARELTHVGSAFIIIAVCLVTYFGVWNNGFIYDDKDLILRNPLIQQDIPMGKIFSTEFWETTRDKSNYYRPLIILSYKIDHGFFGNSAGGYHISNVFYHLITAFLLYALALQWNMKRSMALMAALIFTVSPVRIQSVAWISGRTDIIAAIFAIAALISFRVAMKRRFAEAPILKIPKKRKRKVEVKPHHKVFMPFFFLSALFYFMGLLSKEMIITLPALALIQEYFLCHKNPWKEIKGWLPFAVFIPALILYFYLRHQIIGYALFNTLTEEAWWTLKDGHLVRWLTVPKIFAWYVIKSIFPWPLVFERGVDLTSGWSDPYIFLSILFMGLLAGITVSLYKREDKTAFMGMAWFIVTLIPISNILPVFESCMEHYTYFPGIGFSLFAASLIYYAIHKMNYRKASYLLLVIPVMAYVIGTQARLKEWTDEITLYKDTVEKRPNSYRANTSYGLSLFFAGRYKDAIPPLEKAISLKPEFGRPYYNLGLVYRKMKQNQKAKKSFETAVQYSPTLIWPLNNLGIIHFEMKEYDRARFYWKRILELYPGHPLAMKNMAYLKNK